MNPWAAMKRALSSSESDMVEQTMLCARIERKAQDICEVLDNTEPSLMLSSLTLATAMACREIAADEAQADEIGRKVGEKLLDTIPLLRRRSDAS